MVQAVVLSLTGGHNYGGSSQESPSGSKEPLLMVGRLGHTLSVEGLTRGGGSLVDFPNFRRRGLFPASDKLARRRGGQGELRSQSSCCSACASALTCLESGTQCPLPDSLQCHDSHRSTTAAGTPSSASV